VAAAAALAAAATLGAGIWALAAALLPAVAGVPDSRAQAVRLATSSNNAR
jgi:hypothetical protein